MTHSYFPVRQHRVTTNEDMEETTEIHVLDYDLEPEQEEFLFTLDDVVDDNVGYEELDADEQVDGEGKSMTNK